VLKALYRTGQRSLPANPLHSARLKLLAALATALVYTRGDVPETGAAWTRALEIAESLDDAEYQLRSLWGLWSFHINSGHHGVTLALAQRFCSLAARRPDPNDRLIADGHAGRAAGHPSAGYAGGTGEPMTGTMPVTLVFLLYQKGRDFRIF
jgi:hypothetical protein